MCRMTDSKSCIHYLSQRDGTAADTVSFQPKTASAPSKLGCFLMKRNKDIFFPICLLSSELIILSQVIVLSKTACTGNDLQNFTFCFFLCYSSNPSSVFLPVIPKPGEFKTLFI